MNLRLVFVNEKGEKTEYSTYMKEWFLDWRYEKCYIPEKESTEILEADIDGKTILPMLPEHPTFEDLVEYLKWEENLESWRTFCEISGTINNRQNFEDWLFFTVWPIIV